MGLEESAGQENIKGQAVQAEGRPEPANEGQQQGPLGQSKWLEALVAGKQDLSLEVPRNFCIPRLKKAYKLDRMDICFGNRCSSEMVFIGNRTMTRF